MSGVTFTGALWHAFEEHGMVDGWLGGECRRVLPEALRFIHRAANTRPE